MSFKNVFFTFLQLFLRCLYGQNIFRNDYIYINESESYYKINTLPRTLHEAKTACEREGATLLFLDDENEVVSITGYWGLYQPTINWAIVNMTKSNFRTAEGLLKSDVYAVWNEGEPNNIGGNEDCIALNVNGKLNDISCDTRYPFICKKTSTSIEWNGQCNTSYSGYNFFQRQCYKFHSTPKNWTDAYATCYGEMSYLAVVNDEAEAAHFINLMSKPLTEDPWKTGTAGAIHLGFFNRDGWSTIKGVPLRLSGYQKWAQSQPDGGIGEDCGAMTLDGLLHDVSCSQEMNFICEHDLDPES